MIDDSAGWMWPTLRAAAALARNGLDRDRAAGFRLGAEGRLQAVGRGPATLRWDPARAWMAADVAAGERDFLDLYLPLCGADAAHPVAVGQLGQSLDGFIATAAGDSYYVSGKPALLHLHRLRALCDAVIIGAGTVATDNPLLTTRLVPGANALRVVLDPAGQLPATRRAFDHSAPSLRVCAAQALPATGAVQLPAHVDTLTLPGARLDPTAVLAALRLRGHACVLVEGGGVTVSAFLAAGLLDRLHLLVAPLLIGSGRPGIRIPPREPLADCLRPPTRRHLVGEDVLFDCALRAVIAAPR
ncbi:MAG: RibD family protein [Steroidobacteraceae bacterium]